MSITYLIVVVISAALLFIQSSEKLKNEKIRITGEFKSHSLALDNLVVSIEEHLNLFHKKAESNFIDGFDESNPSSMFLSLSNSEEGSYHLDNIPESYGKENLGNLTGYGNISSIDDSLKDEIEMALSLNSLFQAAKENIPNSSWIYYTSKRRFINIYPWVDSSSFSYLDELKTHEFYRWGLPENNVDGSSFWTPVYIDEAGDGLMVTSAKPIYRNGEFIGTVAIDITLDRLIDFVSRFDHEAGEMLIVNEQDQIIAHPSLGKNFGNESKLKMLDDVLPGNVSGNSANLFDENPMKIQAYNEYNYIWYEMKSAPWRVLYIYNDHNLGFKSWIRSNADFFMLIIALSVMIYISNKVTFKEFINPAGKLVNHISLESKEIEGEVDNKVPPPWLPWFDKITEIFSENKHLIEEIKEKNETLLEKNTALERYMPKTIVIISTQSGCGSSTVGHMLARSFMETASETKSTVYLEYPCLGKAFSDCSIADEGNIYHHPNGFDIWGNYDFGVMPELARSSMLMNNVLENYSNVVINIDAKNVADSEIDVFLKYAKVIVLMLPTESEYKSDFDCISKQIRNNVRQDKTSIYTLFNSVSNIDADVSSDFSVPYLGSEIGFSRSNFDVPATASSVVNELIDRVERTHQISVFIPTTTNIDEVSDTSAYVDKTMALFGKQFGGATCSEANGVWNSSRGALVSETVNIVSSYTTEDGLNKYVDDVIEYVKVIKKELNQDAMAIEINKKLILI